LPRTVPSAACRGATAFPDIPFESIGALSRTFHRVYIDKGVGDDIVFASNTDWLSTKNSFSESENYCSGGETMPGLEYKVLCFYVRPREVETGPSTICLSNVESDVESLVARMEARLKEMAVQGWRVVSINSVLRGKYGEGYGYSLTDAFVVVLERGP
jgi:hypothetical protein